MTHEVGGRGTFLNGISGILLSRGLLKNDLMHQLRGEDHYPYGLTMVSSDED